MEVSFYPEYLWHGKSKIQGAPVFIILVFVSFDPCGLPTSAPQKPEVGI
jgi:hypothetical protein